MQMAPLCLISLSRMFPWRKNGAITTYHGADQILVTLEMMTIWVSYRHLRGRHSIAPFSFRGCVCMVLFY